MMWEGDFLERPKLDPKSKKQEDEELAYLMSLYDYNDGYDGGAEFLSRPESMAPAAEDRRNLNAISLYACLSFVILCLLAVIAEPYRRNNDFLPALAIGISQVIPVAVYVMAQWEKWKRRA